MPTTPEARALPDFSIFDCYDVAMEETGIPLVVTGAKKADSLWRRRNLSKTRKRTSIVHPIKDWTKFDVLAYLEANKIPLPESSGHSATGIDLSTPSLLWLHDRHPEDFARLRQWFPHIDAVPARRDFYAPG